MENIQVSVTPQEGSPFWTAQWFEGGLEAAEQFLTIGQNYECQGMTPGTYLKHEVKLTVCGGPSVGPISYKFRYDLEGMEPVNLLRGCREALGYEIMMAEEHNQVLEPTGVRLATVRLLNALLAVAEHNRAEARLDKLMAVAMG